MRILMAKTWIKKMIVSLSNKFSFKGFNWIDLWHSVIKESVLTIITVLITVNIMSAMGASLAN